METHLIRTLKGLKKESEMKAALRAAWREWIEAEVQEGRNRYQAEEMAIIFQLCKIFDVSPAQIGIVFWPGGNAIGTTHKTGLIMASLTLALICERVDNPPVKFGALRDLLKTLPVPIIEEAVPGI